MPEDFGSRIADALAGFVEAIGQRVPGALFPQPAPEGAGPLVARPLSLNPATWGMGTWLLIGVGVYVLMRPKRRG